MKITYKKNIKHGEKTDIVKTLLETRNIKDTQQFLHPSSPLGIDIAEFGYEKQLKRAFEILEGIYKNNKTVVVYTDYDADGITGGTILWETLHLLGFKVMPYVPHRVHEGYGFSIKGIDAVKEKYNPSLIISVDHGIAAADKVTYAKSIGIPIIITDHHLKSDTNPDDAEAIFHIPLLSGSGVSYFFSKAVFEHFKSSLRGVRQLAESKQSLDNLSKLEYNFQFDYQAIASIGTIADLVPLVGPSRSVVKHGLAAFPSISRVGIKHILKEAKIEGRKITPYEVGFIIAPRINAIGRLEHAIDALRLLCTNNETKAFELASRVGSTNIQRQEMVKVAIEEAKQMVESNKIDGKVPKLIILISDSWHEGIIGLIASKMVELYYRPTIVMTKADGFLKGSARSIRSFHMTHFLQSLKEYLLGVGGHQQAAGFSIDSSQLDVFIQQAHDRAAEQIKDSELERSIETDLKLPLSFIDLKLAKNLEDLQPFGIGNSQPLFFSETEILNAQLFGRNQDHLKLYLKDTENSGPPLEMLAFSKADIFKELSRGQKVSAVYNIGIDTWNNNERLRGRLTHLEY